MKTTYLFIIIITFFMSLSVYAEFYKYKDKNGITRYTDNLAIIPKQDREAVKRFKEPDDFLTPEQKAKKASMLKKQVSEKNQENIKGEDSNSIPPSDKIEEIAKIKTTLDKEYADLTREEALLSKEKNQAKTPESKKKLKEKVREFNKRIDNYEKRRNELKKRVDIYQSSRNDQ